MTDLKLERINPETGEAEYFYPLELTPETERTSLENIKNNHYQIGWVKIGNREFRAALIPVDKALHDDFIQKELDDQGKAKLARRCVISGAYGKSRLCPRQVPNPAYVEGGIEPKTLANRCKECPVFLSDNYLPGREVLFSTLVTSDEDGEGIEFDPVAPDGYNSAEIYEELSREFIGFVREKQENCSALAEFLAEGYSQTEAAREMNKSLSTAGSQTKELRKLILEFLQNVDYPY